MGAGGFVRPAAERGSQDRVFTVLGFGRSGRGVGGGPCAFSDRPGADGLSASIDESWGTPVPKDGEHLGHSARGLRPCWLTPGKFGELHKREDAP